MDRVHLFRPVATLLPGSAALALFAMATFAAPQALAGQVRRHETRFAIVPRLAVAIPLGTDDPRYAAMPGVAVAIEMGSPDRRWGAYMDAVYATRGTVEFTRPGFSRIEDARTGILAITAGVVLQRSSPRVAPASAEIPGLPNRVYAGLGVGLRAYSLESQKGVLHARSGIVRVVTGVGLTGEVALLVGEGRGENLATDIVASVGIAIPR